jgi:hypothetical protein
VIFDILMSTALENELRRERQFLMILSSSYSITSDEQRGSTEQFRAVYDEQQIYLTNPLGAICPYSSG